MLLLIAMYSYSQKKDAKQKIKLEAQASFSINSNGFAPIPSFSLDKPAFIGSVNLIKGRNDGWFVSPSLSLSVKNIPIALFLQATQAIQSNIPHWPGFKWNAGISYQL